MGDRLGFPVYLGTIIELVAINTKIIIIFHKYILIENLNLDSCSNAIQTPDFLVYYSTTSLFGTQFFIRTKI